MPLCYRIKSWSVEQDPRGLILSVLGTSHPGDTNLTRVIQAAFPGTTADVDMLSDTFAGMYIGTEGKVLLGGVEPDRQQLKALLDLMESVITVADKCDTSHCLDLYRTPAATASSPEDWPYTAIGNDVYEAKYRGDSKATKRLGQRLIETVAVHPSLRNADIVCSMPSSDPNKRNDLPSVWTETVASEFGLPIVVLERVRSVRMQKDIGSLIERRENQAGSMSSTQRNAGLAVVLIDDLYMGGETINEATRALRIAGAAKVFGLCAVKTAKGTNALDTLLEPDS